MAYDRKAYYQRTREKQLAAAKAWKVANPERCRATNNKSQKSRRLRDPAGYLFSLTKGRAKEYGLAFDLTVEDLVIPNVCPILNIPIYFAESGTYEGKNPNSPSVDRIDPSLGYIKGNIQIISWRANHLKNNATLEELQAIVNYLVKNENQR